jgi:hypothetical protein
MVGNPVTQRYLDRGAHDESLRRSGSLARYAPACEHTYRKLLLSRPFFVADAVVDKAARDCGRIFDLMTVVPERIFGGDWRRYCAAIGMDELTTRVALRAATGRPPKHGRADMVFDGTSFKLIELNVGSELGGYDCSELNTGLLQVDAFRAFADECGLSYVDTCQVIADTLRRAARPVAGDREPVVVLLEWMNGFDGMPEPYQSFKEAMAAHGLRVELAEIQHVVNRDDKLYLGDEPIDLILRYFMLPHITADPRGEEIVDPVMRAHEAGKTLLFTHLETTMWSYKDNLVFLSDPRYRHAFTPEEGEFIDSVLPWTRRLVDETTEVDGQTVGLLDYCRAHREDLILKPHAGYGAYGTVAGREASDEEWAKSLAENLGGEYIVQRAVTAYIEQVENLETGELEDWRPIWGVLFNDSGYFGTFIRARRASATSVINWTTTTGVTSVFCYPSAI